MSSKYIYVLDQIIYVVLCLYMVTLCIPEIIPVNLMRIILFLGIIRLCIHFEKIEVKSYHLKMIGLFFMVLLPAVFFNDTGLHYLDELKLIRERFISPLMPLFIVLFFIKEKKQIDYLILCLLISFSLTNIAAIFQGLQGIERVAGFTQHCMTLAGILLLLFPLNLILLFSQNILERYKYIYYISVFLAIPAIFYNGTRIVWVGVVGIILMIMVNFIKNKKKLLSYIGVLALIGILFFSANPYFSGRIQSIFDTSYHSNRERILMWESAWNMFKDHPLGVGVGNYPYMYQTEYISDEAKEREQIHPHNVFLYMLAETGFLGAGFYIIMFSYFLLYAVGGWLRKREIYQLIFFIVTTAFLIQGLTDVNFGNRFYRALSEIYWIIMAIYIIQIGVLKRKN